MSGARKVELETSPETTRAVEVRHEGACVVARVAGGAERTFEVARGAGGEVVLREPSSGKTTRAVVRRDREAVLIWLDGKVHRVARSRGRKGRAHGAHDTALEAPMPGTCREVLVSEGETVKKGQRLVILEAMKMEHELKSPRDGVVKSVRCKKGGPVAPGEPLVELA